MERLYDSVQLSLATKIVMAFSGLIILVHVHIFYSMAKEITGNLRGNESTKEIDEIVEQTHPPSELICFLHYIAVSVFFCCLCVALCVGVDILDSIK